VQSAEICAQEEFSEAPDGIQPGQDVVPKRFQGKGTLLSCNNFTKLY